MSEDNCKYEPGTFAIHVPNDPDLWEMLKRCGAKPMKVPLITSKVGPVISFKKDGLPLSLWWYKRFAEQRAEYEAKKKAQVN